MRKVIYLYCFLGFLAFGPMANAQDFLLQGCYWDCPESSSIEIDEASLKFWTEKIKAQAPELGHNGFSYIWLPPASSTTPKIQDLINDLGHLGIQTVSDLPLGNSNDSIQSKQITPQLLASAYELGLNAYQLGQNAQLNEDQIAELLNKLYEKDKSPQLFITTPPKQKAEQNDVSWVNNIVKTMKEEAARLINPRVHDQLLREALRQACADQDYDVRNIFDNSLRDATSLSGFNAITFVNSPNHRNQNDQVNDADDLIENPLLAYAYTLTNNQIGLPAVFLCRLFWDGI